ncbi:MAG: hypothetical protein ACJAQ4_001842 [Cryomorphaceae bacterium]|jgi:hypothetical protein
MKIIEMISKPTKSQFSSKIASHHLPFLPLLSFPFRNGKTQYGDKKSRNGDVSALSILR